MRLVRYFQLDLLPLCRPQSVVVVRLHVWQVVLFAFFQQRVRLVQLVLNKVHRPRCQKVALDELGLVSAVPLNAAD